MDNNNLVCKICGYSHFAKGKLEGYAAVRPVDKFFSFGSALTLTFCKRCGEVVSMNVSDPQKF